jgi:hypothetical protein
MSTGGTMRGGRPDQPQQTQTPFMGGYGNQMSQRFDNQSQGLPSGMTGPQFGGSMMPQPAVYSGAPQSPLFENAMWTGGAMNQQQQVSPPAPTQQPPMGATRGLNALLSFDDFKQRAMDRIQSDYDHYKQNYDSRMQAGQVPPQRSIYQDDFVPRTPPMGSQTMSGLASLFSRLGGLR